MVTKLERQLYEALRAVRDWIWLGDEDPDLAKVDAALTAYEADAKLSHHKFQIKRNDKTCG